MLMFILFMYFFLFMKMIFIANNLFMYLLIIEMMNFTIYMMLCELYYMSSISLIYILSGLLIFISEGVLSLSYLINLRRSSGKILLSKNSLCLF